MNHKNKELDNCKTKTNFDVISQIDGDNTIIELEPCSPKTSNQAINQYISRTYLERKYTYRNVKSKNVIYSSHNYISKHYRPSVKCCGSWFLYRFPFFRWIQKYEFHNHFLRDLIAGLTV